MNRIWRKLLCKVGLHGWSNWDELLGTEDCKKIGRGEFRFCRRCNSIEVKVVARSGG